MNLTCKPHDNKKENLKRKIVTLNERTGDGSIYFIRGKYLRILERTYPYINPSHQQ